MGDREWRNFYVKEERRIRNKFAEKDRQFVINKT
jgi:hypothetical protein